jgi:hypothetical protein
MRKKILPIIVFLVLCTHAHLGVAADKTIGVFIALADNESQGIVPVPKAIGNGNDPDRNLYWGTAEGLKGVFDKSNVWKLLEKNDKPEEKFILRIRTYHHEIKKATLTAKAYKGSNIKECIQAFESAIQAGAYDLVVFIGHNGLMDCELPKLLKLEKQKKISDCIVLCCKSEQYFKTRIEATGGRPILLTQHLMYPGAFILHATVNTWLDGKNCSTIRESAGTAYADNQKLSKKTGLGIFAELKD